MTTQRITKSLVDRLKSGCIVWDDDCRGFGVRRQVRDASYVLKVRVHGRQRFLTIGKHGAPWTPETARLRARRLLADIAEGKDPTALRHAQRAAPNFKEFSDRYLNEHALPRKKPRSVEEDRRNLRLHILPELAKLAPSAGAVAIVLEDHVKSEPCRFACGNPEDQSNSSQRRDSLMDRERPAVRAACHQRHHRRPDAARGMFQTGIDDQRGVR